MTMTAGQTHAAKEPDAARVRGSPYLVLHSVLHCATATDLRLEKRLRPATRDPAGS
jgi:hypothetical protein